MTDRHEELPPTQYLIMEVLGARHRLGETWWTFPNRTIASAWVLRDLGYIEIMDGVAERTYRARLTAAGKSYAVWEEYVSPFEKPIERVRRLALAAQDDGLDLMRLAPSQVLAALDGGR